MSLRQAIYDGLCKTELQLENEQNCEGESVRVSSTDASQFRTNRMQHNTPTLLRDFDSTGRNTPLRGYCGVAR